MTRMGNPGDRGPFAPIVKYLRGIVGKKQFNKLRGKAISLHSQGKQWRLDRGQQAMCCSGNYEGRSSEILSSWPTCLA